MLFTNTFNRQCSKKSSVMSKLVTSLLTITYTILLFQYLKVTLTSRSKDKIELNYMKRPSVPLVRAIKYQKDDDLQLMFNNKKMERLPTDFKYILKWTEAFSHYRSDNFKTGQDTFIKNECEYRNCFLTYQKTLLFDPLNFDAILFDVETVDWGQHPTLRSVHQTYIFVASESSDNFPICHESFDDYYNMTFSYKVDSDIRWSYITIYNHKNEVVGPKIEMNWVEKMEPTSDNIKRRLYHKRRAAAWFVSHCKAKSKREDVAKNIMEALKQYKLEVDTYGNCGKMTCEKERQDDCLELLEQDYYFYFSFENSLAEDYVTEKLTYPLLHYAVPIVFGGANYSRFLPPGSYIDAKLLNASTVAYLMNKAIRNLDLYYNYFRWHKYYKYKNKPTTPDICEVCKALHTRKNHTSIKEFRKWWNSDFENKCAEDVKWKKEMKAKLRDDEEENKRLLEQVYVNNKNNYRHKTRLHDD